MPGMTYYYRIRAMPQVGGDNVGWSTIKSAITVAGAPDRPMMVTAMPDGQNAINLSWQAAEDNGSAIVRYELQRWDRVQTACGRPSATTCRPRAPATRTSMLTADTRYVYRLRAVNRAADNNGMGKWSTLVSTNTAE